MFSNFEDLQKFSKTQFDLATSTATTLTKGVQEIAAEATEYSKKSIEESTAFIEKLLGAKTWDGAIQVQSDYVRSNYENFISVTTRFWELSSNLTKEALKPVETAFTKATQSGINGLQK